MNQPMTPGSVLRVRLVSVTAVELREEAGRTPDRPVRKAAAAAVLRNPYAGRYVEDLSELADAGEELSQLLSAKAVDALDGHSVESYGKAAIVGTAGEIEHAAALLHPKFGSPLRDAVKGGRALIPSAKKRAGPGAAIDVPLHYKDAAYVRSHFDAMEVRLPDAPHADELVVVVAVADGGRPLARIGGLSVHEARGDDGLH
jgi:Amino acid synthesis